MSSAQRIKNILIGIAMIIFGIIMLSVGDKGFIVLLLVLGISLMVYGIGNLIYYFRMARHMVGGNLILYLGIITLDIGAFTISVYTISKNYVFTYLLITLCFSGVVLLLRGLESKSVGAPMWKWKVAEGIALLLAAIICFAFLKNETIAVYAFAIGLFYSAIVRIVSSFRRTAMVYIP